MDSGDGASEELFTAGVDAVLDPLAEFGVAGLSDWVVVDAGGDEEG